MGTNVRPNRPLRIALAALIGLSLASCSSYSYKGIDPPDGRNGSLVYGYLDCGALGLEDGHWGDYTLYLLPMYSDVVEHGRFFPGLTEDDGLHGPDRDWRIVPNIEVREWRRWDTLLSPLEDGVFYFENIEPGDYYLALVQKSYSYSIPSPFVGEDPDDEYWWNYAVLDKPSPEDALRVEANGALYWGAGRLEESGEGGLRVVPSPETSQDDVRRALTALIGDEGWADLIAE